MGFSYDEMMLGFHPRISLEIRPDITKMEKYLDLGFSMRCSTPQDPSDVRLSSPSSFCNYPNDIDTSCLFFLHFCDTSEHALLDLVIFQSLIRRCQRISRISDTKWALAAS